MNILVTGCAGFIGSVLTEYLIDAGHHVIGVDNFQSSYEEAVNDKCDFFKDSIGNKVFLDYLFKNWDIDLVCHLAAESVIGKAASDPYIFFRDNLVYGIELLEAMRKYGCKKLVMSSTGSTYGEPLYTPMDEAHPQNPINAYGESKYLFERIVFWYAKAYSMDYIMFRYYNVGGATRKNGERRKNETRLVPTALKCLKENTPITLFGTDFPTKDGSAIRDYLHVKDVAKAHLLAIDKLNKGDKNKIYNLGSEHGWTVLEILHQIENIYGKKLDIVNGDRRIGDPTSLVASSKFAKEDLGWKPVDSNLSQILLDSYKWFNKND